MSRDPTNEEIEAFAAKLGARLPPPTPPDIMGVGFDVAFRRTAVEAVECYRCQGPIRPGEEIVRSFFRDGRVAHRPCHFTPREQMNEFKRRKRYVHAKEPEPADPRQASLFEDGES